MGMDMGIGVLGFNNVVFKRKFRFTWEMERQCGDPASSKPLVIPRHFVKAASRPTFTMEETEINYLNAKDWIPGKMSWDTITITYIDVAYKDAAPLMQWLATFADFQRPQRLWQGSQRRDYESTGTLTLLDGCGNQLEQWILRHVWPTSVNFGDLDYSASDEATIELQLRYSEVSYQSFCPGFTMEPCCTACS